MPPIGLASNFFPPILILRSFSTASAWTVYGALGLISGHARLALCDDDFRLGPK